ncbi:hypothetical protein [Actinoplanes aureus]|uniref:Uncharacterized protein n=1 Tax=Actinoplanes aureus TaxID=2792083 RepID=A0A931CIW1_9ACTN|nr:hypothetical protein [Actinoplanes aureus]MBG0567936.1 hypothetical protein [Actinoplanes aureus]
MKRLIVVAAVVLVVVLIGAAVLVTRRSSSAPAAGPALPAADEFAPGVCRDAADTILALARVTRQTDVAAVSDADRAELRTLQTRIWELRTEATGAVLDSMTDVVLNLGYLRVRLDTRSAEPQYLEQAEAARARLEKTCLASSAR